MNIISRKVSAKKQHLVLKKVCVFTYHNKFQTIKGGLQNIEQRCPNYYKYMYTTITTRISIYVIITNP